jgi:hypothetical protein
MKMHYTQNYPNLHIFRGFERLGEMILGEMILGEMIFRGNDF